MVFGTDIYNKELRYTNSRNQIILLSLLTIVVLLLLVTIYIHSSSSSANSPSSKLESQTGKSSIVTRSVS